MVPLSSKYSKIKVGTFLPRLPSEGQLDLTHRCNNNCRHCWTHLSKHSEKRCQELTLDEIKRIVLEARAMGCRQWSIFGGEPMLRPDFCEIFDFITKHSSFYSINTNGTLITPEIAGLMRRQGDIMVSIYGATADIHDHITRTPGSFKRMVRGLTLLKEAGVSFTVQIVPMRDSYHQYDIMIEFAKQFSPNWRLGAAWLFLSAFGDVRKNAEIRRQRLDPKQVIDLEHNIFRNRDEAHKNVNTECKNSENYLLKNCILERNMFHIDPYGGLTFCSFIYDPELRYDLKNGTFQKGWEEFLPSLVDFVRADETYKQKCGSCRYRPYCWNCPAYSFLENRNYTDKTDYLCSVARENKKYIEKSREKHVRLFSLAGVKVQFESELPILENTFSEKLRVCISEETGKADIVVHHYFSLPDIDIKRLGKEIYSDSSWKIFQRRRGRVYFKYSNREDSEKLEAVMVFSSEFHKAKIYHVDDSVWKKGNLSSLTLFSEDQILISPYFNKKNMIICHAKGLASNAKGLLFTGADDKETSLIMSLTYGRMKVFQDNYFVLQRENNHIKMIDLFSPDKTFKNSDSESVLTAVYFISLSQQTKIIRLTNRSKILNMLESCLLKPFIDREEIQVDNALLNKVVDNVHFFKLNYNINDDVRYCLNSQSKLYYYHIFEGFSETEHSKPDGVLRNELNTVRRTRSSDNLSISQQRDFRGLHSKKRLFYIAGLSIQVDFNWPEYKHLLDIRFKPFQSEKVRNDLLRLEHYIGLPDENSATMGKLIYQKVPWIIYETRQNLIYVSCSQFEDEMQINKISYFDKDYSFAKIYHKDNRLFKLGNWTALTSFPSDQIWLQQILPQRGGFFIHSSALVLNDQGLAFVGHSEAGKSTMSKMLLKSGAKLLCDDRNIIKRDGQGWNVYGTWSHGELPMVSSAHAPLFGVFILQKSDRNHIDLIKNQKQRFHSIIECIIRPFVTLSWWDKVIPLIHQVSQNVPVFQVEFNQDGKIVDLLHDLVGQEPSLRNTMVAPPTDRI